MKIAVFWFDFFAFTLMFGTFGLAWLAWQRGREQHRIIYMVYIACYSLWILALNFVYLSVNLMATADAAMVTGLIWFRLAISLVVGWVAPLLLYSLGGGKVQLRHALLALLLPGLTAAMVFLLGDFPLAIRVFSGLFNGGLGLACLWVMTFRLERPEFRGFLLLHGGMLSFFGVFWILTVFWPKVASPEVSGLLTGLFLVVWSVNDIRVYLRHFASDERGGLPVRFMEQYAVTPREAEMLEQLMLGQSHKTAAAELGISPRTAESHVYRLYRKCGVGNRVELINLVRSYQ